MSVKIPAPMPPKNPGYHSEGQAFAKALAGGNRKQQKFVPPPHREEPRDPPGLSEWPHSLMQRSGSAWAAGAVNRQAQIARNTAIVQAREKMMKGFI